MTLRPAIFRYRVLQYGDSMTEIPTKVAFQALVRVMQLHPFFEKEVHREAHEALDVLAKYLQDVLKKEGEQNGEH